MWREEVLREIKKYEKAGKCVIVIGDDGTLKYSTEGEGVEYCDQCPHFKLLEDEYSRNGCRMAVCLEVNAKIAGYLENSSEWTNLDKPLYCPKLGRELSKEEKEEAEKELKSAKARLK